MASNKSSEQNFAKNTAKTIAIGCGFGILFMGIFFFVMSLIMGMAHLPSTFIMPIVLFGCGGGAFVSGYIISRITREKGMMLGIVSALMLFILFTVFGFMFSDDGFGILSLIKLVLMCLCGGSGGIIGVNKKTRRK